MANRPDGGDGELSKWLVCAGGSVMVAHRVLAGQ